VYNNCVQFDNYYFLNTTAESTTRKIIKIVNDVMKVDCLISKYISKMNCYLTDSVISSTEQCLTDVNLLQTLHHT